MKRSSVSRTDPSSKDELWLHYNSSSDSVMMLWLRLKEVQRYESEYYSVGRFEHVGCSEAQISFTLITTWHTRMDWFCEPVLFLSDHYNTPDPGSVWHSVCGGSRSDVFILLCIMLINSIRLHKLNDTQETRSLPVLDYLKQTLTFRPQQQVGL